MKLITDERFKHQLIGFLVMLSLASIFVPTILKKSNQRLDSNHSLSMRLPPAPNLPKVSPSNEKTVFQKIRVARVELPPIRENKRLHAEKLKPKTFKKSVLALENPMPSSMPSVKSGISEKNVKLASKPVQPILKLPMPETARNAPKKPPSFSPSLKAASKESLKKGNGYSVQLATFSLRDNAIALVARLKAKGYPAYYVSSHMGHSAVYKVYVGHLKGRDEANQLRQKLAQVIQIRGFVVPVNGTV